jgi:cysteine synthase
VLSGAPVCNARHRIQGGGYAMPSLDMIRPEDVDGFVQVSDSDAITWARELARVEGIFAGYSSGANLAAAAKLLGSDFKGQTAAIIVCDSGLKYLSTDLWLPFSTGSRIQ